MHDTLNLREKFLLLTLNNVTGNFVDRETLDDSVGDNSKSVLVTFHWAQISIQCLFNEITWKQCLFTQCVPSGMTITQSTVNIWFLCVLCVSPV